jgi:hypothetical protein
MRALAGRLRAVAESTSAATARVQGSVAALDFRGPAAGRLRAAIGAWGGRGSRAASELQDLSDLLMRSAAEVEEAQAERARLEQLLAEEAAQAAKGTLG